MLRLAPYVLALSVWLLAAPAVEAVVTKVVSSSTQATSASTISITSFSCSGTDRFVLIHVSSSAPTPSLTSTVTYAGSSTGIVEQYDVTYGTNYHSSIHTLVAPTTSASTITATLASANDEIAMEAICYQGVDQTTPIGTIVTASGSSTTASVTVSSSSNEVVVAALYSGWNGATPGAGETQEEEQIVSSITTSYLGSETGASSVTSAPTQTAAGFNTEWHIGGIPIKPVAVAVVGCLLLQDGTSKFLAQNGTDGVLLQGGASGACIAGGGGATVIPARMLLGVGL